MTNENLTIKDDRPTLTKWRSLKTFYS